MSTADIQKNIRKMCLFRQNMGTSLPREKIKEFWGKQFMMISVDSRNNEREKIINAKIRIVEANLQKFLIFNWVCFIGITGSVASRTANSKDDIDIFVVVRNDRMWLYRGLLTLKLGLNSVRRVWGRPFKNKIDTNFICEERGLVFSSKNIFVLHELLFMIPVYNVNYYQYILGVNYKLMKNFSVEVEKKNVVKTRNYLYGFLNFFAFFSQYIYMLFMRHKPDFGRLVKNNRMGRIEFFPKDFQEKKLREYNERAKVSNLS